MSTSLSNLTLQLEEERRTVAVDTYDFAVRQLLDMIANGDINTAPVYQRKFVWDAARQSEFIESVFLGIPTPSLFMATNRDATWEVVDGVQRLSTLVHFCGPAEQIKRVLGVDTALVLTDLEKLTEFNGKDFADLPRSIQLAFFNRPLRVTTLNDKSDSGVRFDLFERLNSGGVKLEPQEIRNCVYRGPFNDLLKDLAQNGDFRRIVKVSGPDETNGTYEEFVLRFFAFMERYQKFDHSVRDFLNDYMKEGNIALPSEASRSLYVRTMEFAAKELPDGVVRGSRQTPVNLFEAITVGAALVLAAGREPKCGVLQALLTDEELKKLTSAGTNSRTMVARRIEFVRDRL